jgi:hypothetical protein
MCYRTSSGVAEWLTTGPAQEHGVVARLWWGPWVYCMYVYVSATDDLIWLAWRVLCCVCVCAVVRRRWLPLRWALVVGCGLCCYMLYRVLPTPCGHLMCYRTSSGVAEWLTTGPAQEHGVVARLWWGPWVYCMYVYVSATDDLIWLAWRVLCCVCVCAVVRRRWLPLRWALVVGCGLCCYMLYNLYNFFLLVGHSISFCILCLCHMSYMYDDTPLRTPVTRIHACTYACTHIAAAGGRRGALWHNVRGPFLSYVCVCVCVLVG